MTKAENPVVAATEISLDSAIERYLDASRGADESRYQRITAWRRLLNGAAPLAAITPEDIDAGMAKLASEPARVYAGKDADGHTVFRKKTGQRSGATLNRYLVALAALFARARNGQALQLAQVVPIGQCRPKCCLRSDLRQFVT